MASAQLNGAAREEVAPYDELGGDAGIRALVDHFYDAMERLPEARTLRRMHADDLSAMRDRLHEFLSGWLGGPPLYHQRSDAKCIRSAHAPFPIDARARDEWLVCMSRAMDEVGVEEPLCSLLERGFGRMAEMLRNRPD